VPGAKVVARRPQLVQNTGKGRKLCPGILFAGKRAVEMGVDARYLQMRKAVNLLHVLQLIRQEAVSAHSGVDFQVAQEGLAHSLRHLIHGGGTLQRTDGCGGILLQQYLQLLRNAGGAHHEDFFLRKAALPQGTDLLQAGDRKSVNSALPEHLRHGDQAQAVAVSLDYAVNGGIPGLFPEHLNVLLQCLPVYYICIHTSALRLTSCFSADRASSAGP